MNPGTVSRSPATSKAMAFETVDWEFGAERDRLLREALSKSRCGDLGVRFFSGLAPSPGGTRGGASGDLHLGSTQFLTFSRCRHLRYRSRSKWRRIATEFLNAGQGWLVFLVVGFLTGLLAGMIQVPTKPLTLQHRTWGNLSRSDSIKDLLVGMMPGRKD